MCVAYGSFDALAKADENLQPTGGHENPRRERAEQAFPSLLNPCATWISTGNAVSAISAAGSNLEPYHARQGRNRLVLPPEQRFPCHR